MTDIQLHVSPHLSPLAFAPGLCLRGIGATRWMGLAAVASFETAFRVRVRPRLLADISFVSIHCIILSLAVLISPWSSRSPHADQRSLDCYWSASLRRPWPPRWPDCFETHSWTTGDETPRELAAQITTRSCHILNEYVSRRTTFNSITTASLHMIIFV